MNSDSELYKYFMKNWQNCSTYSMAEFIHKLYSENSHLKNQIQELKGEVTVMNAIKREGN